MLVKWFLCGRQHVVISLCGWLWSFLHNTVSLLSCLRTWLQHEKPRCVSSRPHLSHDVLHHGRSTGIVFHKPMHHNVFSHIEPSLVFCIFTPPTGTTLYVVLYQMPFYRNHRHCVRIQRCSHAYSSNPCTSTHVIHPLTSDIKTYQVGARNRNLRRFDKVDCFYMMSIMLVVGKDRS
jgi:hypothetical protein